MAKKRLLDEDDVRALTTTEIDDVLGERPNTEDDNEFLEDYEGDISDEDIEDILNS